VEFIREGHKTKHIVYTADEDGNEVEEEEEEEEGAEVIQDDPYVILKYHVDNDVFLVGPVGAMAGSAAYARAKWCNRAELDDRDVELFEIQQATDRVIVQEQNSLHARKRRAPKQHDDL
jgi:hypothetical protein